jgi:hypothetical protein
VTRDMLLELHAGLPFGVDPPSQAQHLFRWKEVQASCAGPQVRSGYSGHGVDGALGAIGTARPNTIRDACGLDAVLRSERWSLGIRVELEVALAGPTSTEAQEAVSLLRNTLATTWERVPAPQFEVHIRLPSEVVGIWGPEGPLRGSLFFEMTTFVGESMTVVTLVGQTLDEVRRSHQNLCRRATQYGVSGVSSSFETVVGAWRPTGPL